MSRRLEGRVRRLEELVVGPEVVTTEDGLRIAVPPGQLLDAWLTVMAPLTDGEKLPVEPMVLWALATAQVASEDWQLAQIKAAARAELAAQEEPT